MFQSFPKLSLAFVTLVTGTPHPLCSVSKPSPAILIACFRLLPTFQSVFWLSPAFVTSPTGTPHTLSSITKSSPSISIARFKLLSRVSKRLLVVPDVRYARYRNIASAVQCPEAVPGDSNSPFQVFSAFEGVFGGLHRSLYPILVHRTR
eukprot:IDg19852t1